MCTGGIVGVPGRELGGVGAHVEKQDGQRVEGQVYPTVIWALSLPYVLGSVLV
jgi:hypothetical protein